MTSRRYWRPGLLLAGDGVLLNAALWLALSLRHWSPASLETLDVHLVPFNLLFAGWLIVFYAVGLYDLRRLWRLPVLLNNVLGASAVNFLAGIAFFYFFYPFKAVGLTPKTHLVLVAAITPVLVFAWRRAVLGAFSMTQLRQRVGFLGAAQHLREIRRDLRRHAWLGYVPVRCRWPGVDLVVADGRWVDRNWERARPMLEEIVRHRVPVLDLPTFYEGLFGKVLLAHAASASWLFGSVLVRTGHWYHPVKRALDLAAGSLLLLLAAPVLAVLGLLCLAVQGGPVFFGQERVGRGGRTFTMWKLRTMREAGGAAGPFGRNGGRTSRVTRLGGFLRRWRLDELPQL
ncbi:MAG: sugar transferase, partial [bacterium]